MLILLIIQNQKSATYQKSLELNNADFVKQDAPFTGIMSGGDAYSFDYSKPKIGNLPEVTRIEQCEDFVKQDAPFTGILSGGNPYLDNEDKYNFIINANAEKMSIYGNEGKKLLKKTN